MRRYFVRLISITVILETKRRSLYLNIAQCPQVWYSPLPSNEYQLSTLYRSQGACWCAVLSGRKHNKPTERRRIRAVLVARQGNQQFITAKWDDVGTFYNAPLSQIENISAIPVCMPAHYLMKYIRQIIYSSLWFQMQVTWKCNQKRDIYYTTAGTRMFRNIDVDFISCMFRAISRW